MKNVSIPTNNKNQQSNILKRPLFWAGVVTAFFSVSGIPDNDGARDALEEAGYTSIETNGLAFAFHASCPSLIKTSFDAVKDKQHINGVVCTTLFKNRTNIYVQSSEPI